MKPQKTGLVWLMIILCAAMLALNSVALAVSGVSVTIPLKSVLVNAPDNPETFIIIVQAQGSGTPMPSGARNGRIRYSIVGSGSVNFKVEYSQPGQYVYQIYEYKGTADDYRYDSTEYELRVQVIATAGDVLKASVTLHNLESGDKVDAATFVNRYKDDETTDTDDTPQTADTRNTYLYIALIGLLALAIAVVLLIMRREKRRDERYAKDDREQPADRSKK